MIVIVNSKDVGGALFKYINVREESTMVARLPQQVLLLFILGEYIDIGIQKYIYIYRRTGNNIYSGFIRHT